MDNELYHHGILGMKWGVRRYQNSDGSLTSVGKNRYNKNNKSTSYDKKKQSKINNKQSVKQMSDEELRKKISRLELEKKYSELLTNSEKKSISRGKKIFLDALESSGKNTLSQVSEYAMASVINGLLNKDIVRQNKGSNNK